MDFPLLLELLRALHLGWMLLALLLYNLSRVSGGLRLGYFFAVAGAPLTPRQNILLYYLGMFYNLFLPGGIGGDGYKVMLLKGWKGVGYKPLIEATLLDRVGGLLMLVSLLALLIGWKLGFSHPVGIGAGVVAIMLPLGWRGMHVWWFRPFGRIVWRTQAWALGVQAWQLLTCIALLMALGVTQGWVDYLGVFLLSSVVSVVPFTVGGVGARELVFLLASQHLQIETHQAVAFSTLFFLLTAVSSLAGALVPDIREATA